MEIRQILMVALFMFAAAIMKSAMPGQVAIEVVADEQMDATLVDETPLVTALIPVTEVLLSQQKSPILSPIQDTSSYSSGFNSSPIPGSLIALVVAAMGLVSVARRPL